MARSAATLRLSALSHSPIASRASIWLATRVVLSIPYRRTASSPRSPDPCRLSRPSQHRQHVGERDVRVQERKWIAALLGELECPPELRDALVGAAEVGQVSAEVQERPEFHRV